MAESELDVNYEGMWDEPCAYMYGVITQNPDVYGVSLGIVYVKCVVVGSVTPRPRCVCEARGMRWGTNFCI